MEIFLTVCFIVGFAFLCSLCVDLLNFLFGLLLSCFSAKKFPRVYFCGIRLLAMSEFGRPIVARRCKLDCDKVKCGNWTCPKYCKASVIKATANTDFVPTEENK